ncbi:MAG: hypothetical protein ACXW2T_07410, partial [Allosphingosinicella sp.]
MAPPEAGATALGVGSLGVITELGPVDDEVSAGPEAGRSTARIADPSDEAGEDCGTGDGTAVAGEIDGVFVACIAMPT